MLMTVNKAVRALRKHVKKTQQVFATELGMSISALQNYEQNRTPEPKQLMAFQRAARDAGRDDLANVFQEAFRKALGGVLADPIGWYEREAIQALERCLSGSADYQDIVATVMSAVALAVQRRSEREVRWEAWPQFVAESVKRGYAFDVGGQVKWIDRIKRGEQYQ